MQFGIFNRSKKCYWNYYNSLHQPSVSTYYVSHPGDKMQDLSCHGPSSQVPSCTPELLYQVSSVPFVLPASGKTLFSELLPPKQMYPVILLLKMPQWFSTVFGVKSEFLSVVQKSCPQYGSHPESTAPQYPHLQLLAAHTPPSTNASYTLNMSVS